MPAVLRSSVSATPGSDGHGDRTDNPDRGRSAGDVSHRDAAHRHGSRSLRGRGVAARIIFYVRLTSVSERERFWTESIRDAFRRDESPPLCRILPPIGLFTGRQASEPSSTVPVPPDDRIDRLNRGTGGTSQLGAPGGAQNGTRGHESCQAHVLLLFRFAVVAVGALHITIQIRKDRNRFRERGRRSRRSQLLRAVGFPADHTGPEAVTDRAERGESTTSLGLMLNVDSRDSWPQTSTAARVGGASRQSSEGTPTRLN